MKWIQVVLLSLACCTTSFATPAAPKEKYPSTVSVNEKEKTFTVEFKSNRTTGYSWFLSQYDTHLIKPIAYQYKVPNVSIMGASGVSVWTFQVLPAAKSVPVITTITWLYARPWQKPGDAKSHSITVYFTH